MKKVFALILAALMLLSMSACGKKTTAVSNSTLPLVTETPTEAPAATPSETPAEAPADTGTASPSLGTYDNFIYTNEFLGIRCELNENWIVADSTQLAEIIGAASDMITDEELAQIIADSGSSMVFYASADEGLVSMNIVTENLGVLYGTVLDEESYLNLAMASVPQALESIGLTDVTMELVTLNYLGTENVAVQVHGLFQGMDFYETIVPRKVGNYMALLTIASYYENIGQDLLENFSLLES